MIKLPYPKEEHNAKLLLFDPTAIKIKMLFKWIIFNQIFYG